MTEREETRLYNIPKLVWLLLAGIGILMIGLVWWGWNGRFAPAATTDNTRILYLGWEDGESVNQLYLVNPEGNKPIRLTDTPFGVVDYAVSPDATQIAYSVADEDGSIDLWLMRTDGRKQKRIWKCENALCTQPVWAADARRLIVERRTVSEPGAPPDSPQLWWLDTQTGETLPVFADANQTGLGVRLSPDDQWLSYIVPEAQEIHVTHLATGESITIPSQTGEPAVWYPDGEALMISGIWFQGESFSQHLFTVDLESAELTNISGEAVETNDSLPVFSPDGEWIAFGRKKPRAPMGKQLWLMRPDGSGAVGITENADIHYNNPSWSPDGEQIVVQAYFLTETESSPGLWLVDVESGELEELVSPGIQPVWLP
ncbi:MAG: hypothetical protein GWP17_02060 [Aquificales bacterium]|nr:hypothetical protein [Aquificales bacterium]